MSSPCLSLSSIFNKINFSLGNNATVVRVGEHNLTDPNNVYRNDYDIESFLLRNYSSSSHIHDIALIKLKESIQFNVNVRPGCLHQNRSEKLLHQGVVAIGFGALGFAEDSSSVLMKVNLTVIHPSLCANLGMKVSSQVCVAGKETHQDGQKVYGDTCQGEIV